jgi:aspartyl-tRNA synthetase
VSTFITEQKRTHRCGELRASDIGTDVVLMGWVHSRRDHGGCVFVDLRDLTGLTQIKFDPSVSVESHQVAERLRSEWVIAVAGQVISRGDNVNAKLPTGEIEVEVSQAVVFSESDTPRFQIRDGIETNEDLRLQYRFLDLRRPEMQKRIVLRSRVTQVARNALTDLGFLELETPILTRSTPEGARDYLVPSRVNPGTFYALPQSPQLFKQLYMVSGYDRYYQICRCFRDEDLRADRQPEFTQIDIEMSFVSVDDVIEMAETITQRIFKEVLDVDVALPIQRITYDESMRRFGVDAPDLRFGMELVELTDLFAESGFKAFAGVVASGGVVKAMNVKGGATLSRKQLDDVTQVAKTYGAKGLAWIKKNEGGWQGPIVKFLSETEQAGITESLDFEVGDVVMFVADKPSVANAAMGNLRTHLAHRQGLISERTFRFVWVTDFPAFDYDDEGKRWNAIHHPFTAPRPDDVPLLDSDPGRVYADAYDLVLNGNEIAGGSIRIHDRAVQSKVFELLGIGASEAQAKFGFLLEALKYGAPPHGGIAFGFDRMVMWIAGAESIRDVIAFPKTQRANCLMTEAPAVVDDAQLRELGIQVVGELL